MGISERPSDMAQMGELVGRLRERDGYREPRAFGLGIATVADCDGSVLDTWFGSYNLDENLGAAALVAAAAAHEGGTGTFELSSAQISEVLEVCRPATDDMSAHANLRVLTSLVDADTTVEHLPITRRVVATFIEDLDAAPIDASDVYLRLHLLSSRTVAPHGVNLDGAFGLLTNVVWTTLGPCDVASFDSVRCSLRAKGVPVSVWGVDKFPRMVDYVVPTGVRIAEADRVRLGAHLAEGTTVMHEGFVNFNAGTLGPAMVEGRISAGVVVGANSDVGGSASIMGTLSGGGKEVISVGEDCLLGANSGLGISLGDRCVVEAGLYVTGGTIVTLPDGTTCKARELSGRSDLLFRRNSALGRVEVLPRSGTWSEGLNTALHSN